MSLTDLWIGLATAIGLGSTYALMAVSFSIVLAASGIFNFALESVVTLGAISSYALIVSVGLPSLVAGLVILVGGALAGAVMYLVVGRVFEQRSSDYTGAIA